MSQCSVHLWTNNNNKERTGSPEQPGRCEWSPDPGSGVAQDDVDISCVSAHQQFSQS